MIVIVFTGGTISMRHDSALGGAVPALSGRDILAAARGVEAVADVEVDDFGTFPGPHMSPARMWALRGRVLAHLDRAEVDGVVIAHGTDTLEESAYLLARSSATEKPIVFTGAMRAASDLGWDGPANLIAAVRTAASKEACGQGVLVVMGERVFAGADVTKSHTHMLDAFESPGLGPLGVVDDGRVVFRRETPATRTVVVAAMGRGNVPPEMVVGIERWIDDRKPVVIASRAQRGRVGPTYGYPGGGRRLLSAGAIFAGSRRPQQARIDLMLGLGAGLHAAGLRELFDS